MADCTGLRVLLVGSYPPPFGGIATHLVALIPGLMARGAADIAVITMGDSDRVETVAGATVYRTRVRRHLPVLANPKSWPLLWKVKRALTGGGLGAVGILREAVKAVLVDRIARAHRSEVVAFYHSNAHLELVPLAAHWRTSRGTVLTVFGEVYGDPAFMRRHKNLMEKMIAAPHAIWASSAHCARSFSTIGITRPIESIFIGVDIEERDSAKLRRDFRDSNGFGETDVLILFMGRFIPDMGLDVLLAAVPDLLAADPNIRVVLAGAHGELSDRAAAVAAEIHGRVLVLQNVTVAMQASLYAAADVVVAPSYDQRACMGLSIKEAMAASRAVVATDSGGIPEAVLHGVTGLLVPLDPASRKADVRILKEHILTLAADARLREQFGRAGRARTGDIFSVERTIDRVAGVFMRVRPGSDRSA